MRTVIISDVHLGDPAARVDAFFHHMTASNADRLILAGDLFDLWLMSPRKLRKKFEAELKVFRVLKTCGIKLEYLLGNHDENYLKDPVLPLDVLPVVSHAEVELTPVQKFAVLHGHQFDKYLKDAHFLYKLGFYFKMFRRFACPSYWRNSPTTFSKLTGQMHKAAEEQYQLNYTGVIMGHTHVPTDLVYSSGFRVMDCGAWLTDELHYVHIQAGLAELRNFT